MIFYPLWVPPQGVVIPPTGGTFEVFVYFDNAKLTTDIDSGYSKPTFDNTRITVDSQ